jgi:hypothetical protein
MAEPVTEECLTELSSDLFHYLENVAPCTLVPPAEVKVTYAMLLSQEVDKEVREVLTETGRSFSADAVLFGYVYRWRERKGTPYSVDTPASVAFDLHVLSSHDGSILWEGSFNKAQLSLSENLLDFSTFMRSGGKWLTARELARIGVEKLVREFCPPQ